MSDSPSFTQSQLAAARAKLWQQKGEPILVAEAMQHWLAQMGLVLWTPRAQQLPAPAPSFAEAAFGSTHPEFTLTELSNAQELLQRLVAQGQAIPLNLLGTLGDTPDFVVSPQVLTFVFTLRGDKGWKKAPQTTGPNKVSPLAARLYELLAEHGETSVRDLVVHAGREVTEAAVLRSLGELWAQLRVFPQPRAEGTVWELASARYTKQLKAGANAGQPTALSALISLYLGQAIAATTEEIEIALSPVASRSRIRDVVHGLSTTRQLEERVIDGKTMLFITDSLPEFELVITPVDASELDAAEPRRVPAEEMRSETEAPLPGRIKKFAPREGGRSFGARKPFGDRERRPFSGGEGRPPRKDFGDKPRREYKPRTEGDARPPRRDLGGDRPAFKKSFGDRPPRKDFGGGERKPFGDRPPRREFGSKPPFQKSFGGDRPSPRRSFGGDAKPSFTKPWEEERKPRRAAFDAAAEAGGTGGHATPRYPRFDDRKGPGGPPRREFKSREGGDARPPRREFGGDRPAFKKSFGDRPPRKEFGGERKSFGDRPPRRDFGDKPKFAPREGARPYKPRTEGDRPPYKPRFGGDAERPKREYKPRTEGSDRPRREYKPRAEGDTRPPRSFDRVAGDKKSFSSGARKFGGPSKFGAKSFGDRKPAGRSFGDKKFGSSSAGPKKFGAGPSKFGGAKKFGGPKKFDSGKGKPRPQGAPRKKRKEGDAE